jgi:Zn-dependent peptidase ImmA (M78 family)
VTPRGGSARLEREANEFANELIMPAELLATLAQECGFNLALLAGRFEVSVPAIEIRLLRLDLLPGWMRA